MSNSALDLAKYTVTYCQNQENPISNLHLQKILYFIQRDTLQTSGYTAFDDPIEAWKHGPVVPTVYFYFTGYGAMPITWDFSDEELDFSSYNDLIDEYSAMDPWDLVHMSHVTDGAWDQVYCEGGGNRNVIPVALIQQCG